MKQTLFLLSFIFIAFISNAQNIQIGLDGRYYANIDSIPVSGLYNQYLTRLVVVIGAPADTNHIACHWELLYMDSTYNFFSELKGDYLMPIYGDLTKSQILWTGFNYTQSNGYYYNSKLYFNFSDL
jgi:hypothetical protein